MSVEFNHTIGGNWNMRENFRKFAERAAVAVGSHWAFFTALLIVAAWVLSGPYFQYSDTWQLVINTGTTIITFLIVFLIQNTQNRDASIIALKLDELLRAIKGARTSFVSLDHLSDDELETVHKEFNRLSEKYGALLKDDLEHVRRELSVRKKSI